MDASVNKILEALTPALSAELQRLSEEASQQQERTRQELETDFAARVESAVREAEANVKAAAESEKAMAVAAAREAVAAELQQAVEQARTESASAGHQTETQFAAEREQWILERSQLAEERGKLEAEISGLKEEMAQLRQQVTLWRTYSEAQTEIGDCLSQPEMLSKFMNLAEPFASSFAIYLAKPEGLELWKSRGGANFPKTAAKDSVDSETYFKTVVVRDRTLAAICAKGLYKVEPLDYLAGCLGRAVETFGMKLKTPVPRPAVTAVR